MAAMQGPLPVGTGGGVEVALGGLAVGGDGLKVGDAGAGVVRLQASAETNNRITGSRSLSLILITASVRPPFRATMIFKLIRHGGMHLELHLTLALSDRDILTIAVTSPFAVSV